MKKPYMSMTRSEKMKDSEGGKREITSSILAKMIFGQHDLDEINKLYLKKAQIKYYYRGKRLKTDDDYYEMLETFPMKDLEEDLLSLLVFTVPDRFNKKSSNVSLFAKVDVIGIPEYLQDRDLNHLIMYYYFLKEAAYATDDYGTFYLEKEEIPKHKRLRNIIKSR